MATIHDEQITLELAGGIPTAFTRRGQHWTVIDTPTELGNEAAVYSGIITHPPRPWTGWRFMARDKAGDVLTFDIRIEGERCIIIRIYR